MAPVRAKTRIAANSATGRPRGIEVVGAEEDREGDDGDEDEVEVRRQGVHAVRAAERGSRGRPDPYHEGRHDHEPDQAHADDDGGPARAR